MLSRRPDAPVPSNFTARVLQEIEREVSASRRKPVSNWVWRVFVPRAGLAMAVVAVAGVFIHQHKKATIEAERKLSLTAVAEVQSLPSVEVLEDFDAIRSLGGPTGADEDLLALNEELQSLSR